MSRVPAVIGLAMAALLAGAMAGCTVPERAEEPGGQGLRALPQPTVTRPAPATSPTGTPEPAASPTGTPEPLAPVAAPAAGFGVERATFQTSRGAGRPMEVTLWYPRGDGPFPVVVFAHGLLGLPGDYVSLLTHWARAGFVVAAPAFPRTSRGVAYFDVLDVVNQPADMAHVVTQVLALYRSTGHPLQGRLDVERVVTAGHSAGGITTVGTFTTLRDDRLDGGIVLAGNAAGVGDTFGGAPVPLLFVHGDRDALTPYSLGRAVYARSPWPKGFLTMPGEGHNDPYLKPSGRAFPAVAAATTDFLRWVLYGDPAARQRLADDAAIGGAGLLEDQF
jgi:dienelactone hydrolase